MNNSNLKDIEKRTYISYHQDGLLDIFIGTYILLFGIGILLQTITDFSTWFVIPAIFPALMVPIWMSAKKKITIPRIGYVKMGNKGSNKIMAVFIGTAVAGLGMFMLVSFGSNLDWAVAIKDQIISNSMIIIGIAGIIICSIFAYSTGLKRLYAYGLITFIIFITGYFVSIPFAYFLLTIGTIITISGFILLWQFIKKHPLIDGGIVSDK